MNKNIRTPNLKILLFTFFSVFFIALAEPSYALKPYEQDMINVYKNVSPSVVSVMTVTIEQDFFLDPVPREGAGSGVVIDTDGHILTNNHVIEGANQIRVAFGKDQIYPAVVIGRTPNNDLAVLRVNAPKNLLKPAKLGNSSSLQVGQTAIAIGNPFGILGRSVTAGIISAINRDVKIGRQVFRGMIQTDAAINSGNSGGPLVNTNGEVIGINTLIFSSSGGSVGVGFSIPIDVAKRFIPDLLTKGEVTYPWLGVSVLPINERIAQLLSLPVKEGLLVLSTVPGSAAQKGGIRGGNKIVVVGNVQVPTGGDIITGLDNEKIRTVEGLTSYLETNKSIGDRVSVKIVRGKQSGTITVTLQARPQN